MNSQSSIATTLLPVPLMIALLVNSHLAIAEDTSSLVTDNSQQTTAPAAIVITSNNFDSGWVNAGDPLTLQVNRLPDPNEGDLHLVVGNTDVTSLIRATMDAELVLDTNVLPLPQGNSEVVLYLVTTNGQWQELSRTALQVHSPAGFETAEIKPRLNLINKGQLDENHSEDAGEPQRAHYQDLAVQTGFTTHHSRDDLDIRSSMNLVGSSVRQEALRFGEKGNDAPKLDLSDYLLEVNNGAARFSVGHINYGNNPLLLNGVGNRGLMAQYRFNDRLDVSLSSMNGTSIVGYPNFFGQTTRDHNISAAAVGFEFLKSRPGGLRMELTYMDASIESQFNFDVGEVPDAETNRGFGLRLTGSTESGRLRGDLSFARSRYLNPNDPILAQGDTLVEVRPTIDNARHLELSYDLLQNRQLSENIFSSLSLTYTHDRADPLYKSVGAFTQADREANQIALNGQLGQVNLQVQHIRSEDNINDVPTILKTKTRSTSATLGVPLQSLFGDAQNASSWWPNLSYNFSRIHQFAANSPDLVNSGFNNSSHLPDQVNTSHGLNAQWSLKRWNLGYQLSLNDQDNRQTGRDKSDFKVLTQSLNTGIQVTDSFSLGANLGFGRNADREQDLDRDTRTWGINADWRITPKWSLNGSYTATKQDDSQDLAVNNSESANAQLSWNFTIPAFGRKLPGQTFIRYSLQDNDTNDRLFGFESNLRTWTINSGLSLSLF